MGLAALSTLSVRLSVCLLTSTSIQRLIGHSLQGGKGGGQPGGGELGDQRLPGRGCKPQTNYTPSPNAAGRITRKNILFDRVCRAGKYDPSCRERPPVFPSAAGGDLTGAALARSLSFSCFPKVFHNTWVTF